MEGVNTNIPVATIARTVLTQTLPRVAEGGKQSDVSDVAEERARAVEAQAQRQADSMRRQAQDQADALRERGEKARAKARVGAATSGLALSGTSLLSLENLEAQNGGQVDELLGHSELGIGDMLASAGDQARSIRLSGRAPKGRTGSSLLNMAGLFSSNPIIMS